MTHPELPYSASWTLPDHVDRAAAPWPDREALVFGANRRTFEEFADATFEFARALYALGVGHGDTVGVLLPNGIDALVALYGTTRLGAIAVPLDPGLDADALRATVCHADVRVLVASEREPEDISPLWLVAVDGDPELLRATAEQTPEATQVCVYGSTEAGGLIALSHLDDPLELRIGSAGRPFHGIELKILDPETGAELLAGEQGQVAVRGWSLFEGYHKDSAPLDADGYVLSSDLGSLDDSGRLFLGDVSP